MPTLLATYTPEQLKGAGISVSSLPGDIFGPLIIEFNNEDTPGYFTLEQDTGKNEFGYIPSTTTDYAAGSFSGLNNINPISVIESPFKFSVAVPPGTSSMVFDATVGDGSGEVRLRGTSNFTLKIYDQ